MTRRRSFLLLLPLVLFTGTLQVWADRASSSTFDELVLVSMGVRGVRTGDWGMVVDQPPLMPVLYGAAASTAVTALPDEGAAEWGYETRWIWGRALLFGSGNDPRAIATASRAVGMAATAALLILVWWVGTRIAGPLSGLLAAAFTGLHPEVITHGAVAYNDLPMALAFLGFLWAADRAIRAPDLVRGAVAGLALALAFGVKYSAIACLPVAALLVAAQAVRSGRDADWRRKLVVATLALCGTFWVGTALLWGGDPTLYGFRLGFWITLERAAEGHPAPAWLFGATSTDGFRAFFPIAWVVKTPVALQVATALGAGFVLRRAFATRAGWRTLLDAPMRAPVIGLVVFGALMIRSSQNVGFRYALPVLPLLALIAAAGWAGRPGGAAPSRRALASPAVVAASLVVLTALSVLGSAPFFLSYRSEWTALRSGPPALLDSSVDWGQGLLALKHWMDAADVPAVRLSYFGSALPEGYGIAMLPLRSFLPQRPTATPGVTEVPEWTAISITNLHGLYFDGDDPFAEYRRRTPDAIVGGSILLFHDVSPSPTDPST